MELVGDFLVADPIFKGCYGDFLLYSDTELCQLRWQGIHLPTYLGEIPLLLAPSYWQAWQPKVTKQSPPRAVTPNLSLESPKTIRSSGKGSLHCSSGCSSNTSTPKYPDLTSAKKPSSSKEQTSNGQETSPKSCGSGKCGHSPTHLPSQSDTNGKMSTQKTSAHSTQPSPSAPAPLMASAVQWDPTVMEPSFCPLHHLDSLGPWWSQTVANYV